MTESALELLFHPYSALLFLLSSQAVSVNNMGGEGRGEVMGFDPEIHEIKW